MVIAMKTPFLKRPQTLLLTVCVALSALTHTAHAYWSQPEYNVTCRMPYQLNVEHANGGGGTEVGAQLSNGQWTYLDLGSYV